VHRFEIEVESRSETHGIPRALMSMNGGLKTLPYNGGFAMRRYEENERE